MQKLFNKILVPVDLTGNSKVVVEKACAIARQYQCSLHLLYVEALSPFSPDGTAQGKIEEPLSLYNSNENCKIELEKLCGLARNLIHESLGVNYSMLHGTWDETIIALTQQDDFDLVLIEQQDYYSWKTNMQINAGKLANKTKIPVITLPTNRRLTRLYSIVIPITDFLPVRKLMYGVYIASNDDTTIKLLGIENEKTAGKVDHYMQKSFKLIRDNCAVKVEMEKISSLHITKAVNAYAKKQSADLVILNPGTQIKMPGFFASLFGKLVPQYSALPVLTISPV